MPTVLAPAKVNLRLNVLARETNGYHQIETLFCLTTLSDELIIEEGPDGIQLDIDGEVPGDPDDNLACRAARAFHQVYGTRPAVRIQLRKRIPAGAGLGGGSSDAAAVLLALDDMHGNPLKRQDLLEIGASIGSDVPFFVSGAGLALAWGRGERLFALPSLPVVPMLIAAPAEPMPTEEAYATLDAARGERPPATRPQFLTASDCASWDRIARIGRNDFDEPVMNRIPAARTLRDTLAHCGARLTMLSGSGSAVFGVFDGGPDRDAAAAAVRTAVPGCRVFETYSAPGMGR